ncbi:Transducin (beta)-like 1 X-linked receptor 1, partial [Linnemannia gamsii]
MAYSGGSTKVTVLASDCGDSVKDEPETVHLPQPTNNVYIPPVNSSPIGPKDKELPLLPTAPHLRYGIFTENAPKPAMRSSTPTSPQARMESTLQLVFCARLLAEDCFSSTLESSAAKVYDLDDAGREWLNAVREDPSALARIHWLVSRLVAEFVKDTTLGSSAISEVVLLGPVLCQVDYCALLSNFVERFDQAALHNEALLQGMIQLLQSAPTRFIADDDLIRIVEVIRKRLEFTHVPSKDHVYQLVIVLSKVLEVMTGREVKGLSRQRAHQLLVAALRSLKGVEDDEFLEFQINYAYQTSLSLPDDETSFQAFLRSRHLFKLDPKSAPIAVEHLQQGTGNAIDVVKFNIDGTPAIKATSECASQAVEKAYWSAKKRSWFLTLQEAYAFVREGRLVDFNQLVCDATCRLDPNFLQGIFLILGELAVDPLWDIQTRLRAIDFLGDIFKNELGQGQNGRTAIWITSILTQISTMGLPNISDHARSRLRNLGQGQSVGAKDCRLLFTPLPHPASSPLLERALDIEQVHYTLDCMRFQRLQGFPQPFSIPLFAKATLTDFDNCSFLLMKRVLEFLDSDNRVFLLLGDSGSGKSTFCRQLELELWNRYKDGGKVPLYINLPSINKPHCDLIEKHLRHHHNILDPILIQEIKRDRQFVLICDGYDESRLTANIYVSNQLHQLKAKMVIACRNTFLSREYQGYFRPHGDNNYDNKLSELFEEATIVPFTESDIKDYVNQHVLLATAQEPFTALSASSYDDILKKLHAIPNLMNLVSNPFLLTLALSALPSRSIEALQDSELEAMQQDLYDGFFRQWVHLGQKRLQGTKLKQDVRTVFDKLSDDFFWYVRDYSKRLAHAIYSYQGGRPVVKVSRKHKEKWKDEFFGPGIETTLLRETSPLTRAGIRHWFIHKSLLDYFFSLCAFDPDDSDDYDSDDDDDEHWGGGDESRGGGGNSFGGDGDGLMNDNGGATDGDGGAGSTGNNSGSSGGGSGFSGGNEGSSNDHDSSANENHDSASNGGAGNSNSNGGSSGDGGDGFHGDKNGSNGDEDGSRRRKDDVRSKRKANSTQSRSSASSNSFSKWNFFKEPSVLQFLVERARSDPRLKKRLFSAIKRAKSSSVPSLAAANAITILFKSGERFQEMDLNGVNVPGNYLSTESAEPNFHAECSLTGRELVRALIPPPVSIRTPAIAAPMPFSTTITLATPTASLETRLLNDDKIESIPSFEVDESGGIHIPSKCVSLETAEPLLDTAEPLLDTAEPLLE